MSIHLLSRRTRALRLPAAGGAAALMGLGVWLPLADQSQAATNSQLSISPATGSTISAASPIVFTVPAACPSSANQAVMRIKGQGTIGAGDSGDPDYVNITAAGEPTTPTTISLSDDTWDNIAQNKSLPRPLNGTYTVKWQCAADGEIAGLPSYDRDVAFVGSGAAGSVGTWSVVGGGGGGTSPTPTPINSATPTPTPTGAATPTPEATVEPTPEPEEECDATVEDCSDTNDEETDDESEESGGDNLPTTGGQSPNDAITLAVLLSISGLMLLAFAYQPRWLTPDSDEDSTP